MLREATERVRDPHPFHAPLGVWTFVTFSLPEELRSLRSRLRSTLTWEGFAPLRDGLWVAPGEIDLGAALEALRGDLPPGAILAFHGRELPGFPMARQRPSGVGCRGDPGRAPRIHRHLGHAR